MDERQSVRNVAETTMSSESNIDWIDRRLRRLEDNQPKAYQVRMRAIELVMGTFGIPRDEMDNEFREKISRAEAIANFILNGEKPLDQLRSPLVSTTDPAFAELRHEAESCEAAHLWLDDQGISRSDGSVEYSLLGRISLLLATTNVAVTPKEPEKD